MPEGDTIAWAANRIRPVLQGAIPDQVLTPQPRHARDRWPERLAGRRIRSVDTHGKHLFIRFGPPAIRADQGRADRMPSGGSAGGLVLHSHLGMTGSWFVGREPRISRRTWLALAVGERWVTERDGPLLELITEGRTRFDQRLAALGPDVLAPDFDKRRFLARLREDDPTRLLGDALLDQRNVAGIGNIWKAEGCWEAQVDPWRRLGEVSDDEALAVIDGLRPRMMVSAAEGPRTIAPRVYKRVGQPCPRCGARVTARGQGDANRTTYWCPECQR